MPYAVQQLLGEVADVVLPEVPPGEHARGDAGLGVGVAAVAEVLAQVFAVPQPLHKLCGGQHRSVRGRCKPTFVALPPFRPRARLGGGGGSCGSHPALHAPTPPPPWQLGKLGRGRRPEIPATHELCFGGAGTGKAKPSQTTARLSRLKTFWVEQLLAASSERCCMSSRAPEGSLHETVALRLRNPAPNHGCSHLRKRQHHRKK